MKKSHSKSILALLLLSTTTTTAFADNTVEEIVVTATMQAASKQTLAGNTATLDDLDFIAFSHPADGLNRLPGVNIQGLNGQEHLTSLRSPVLTGGAGAGSFLYLEDGVPLRAPGFANVNGLFEAHTEQAGRIEVVRGPGSALYGSNAVHGMINVISPDPFSVPGLSTSLTYGSHENLASKLQVGFQGEDKAGLFSLTLKHDDGWRADSGYDEQKASVHAKWGTGVNSFAFTAAFSNLDQETAPFVPGLESYKDDILARSNPNPEAYRNAKSWRAHLRWERDFGNDLALSLTPYARKTDMNFLMHFLPGQATEENGHQSVGLQAKLYKDFPGGHLIIGGLDLDYTEGALSEFQTGPTVFSFVTGAHYDYAVEAKLISPFIYTEWSLTDKTRLTAGLRLDHTIYNYKNNLPSGTVGRFQRAPDRDDEFTTATPKLGISHAIKDELALFALYARGQRAPQTTDLYRIQINQIPGDADPETIDSFELGLRDSIGPFRFELAAYVMKKDNFFFRDSDGFNVNDGETLHRGVELGFTTQPLPQLIVSGSLTYGVHTYAFDNLVAANSTEDIRDGNDIDTAPRLLGNLRLGWTPSDTIRTELEWVHMDEYYLDGANIHDYGGHDLLNLRASWALGDTLELSAQVLNVTDAQYASRANFSFGNYSYMPGEERFYSIGIKARF